MHSHYRVFSDLCPANSQNCPGAVAFDSSIKGGKQEARGLIVIGNAVP